MSGRNMRASERRERQDIKEEVREWLSNNGMIVG